MSTLDVSVVCRKVTTNIISWQTCCTFCRTDDMIPTTHTDLIVSTGWTIKFQHSGSWSANTQPWKVFQPLSTYSCRCRGKTHQRTPQLSHISSTPIPSRSDGTMFAVFCFGNPTVAFWWESQVRPGRAAAGEIIVWVCMAPAERPEHHGRALPDNFHKCELCVSFPLWRRSLGEDAGINAHAVTSVDR